MCVSFAYLDLAIQQQLLFSQYILLSCLVRLHCVYLMNYHWS